MHDMIWCRGNYQRRGSDGLSPFTLLTHNCISPQIVHINASTCNTTRPKWHLLLNCVQHPTVETDNITIYIDSTEDTIYYKFTATHIQ